MSTPTDTDDPRANPSTPTPTPNRVGRLVLGGAVAAALVAGAVASTAAGPFIDDGRAATAAPPATRPAETAEIGEVDLADLTLDELAHALADLGLELTITPADDGTFDDDGQGADADDDHGDGDIDHDHGDEQPVGTFAVDGDTIDLSSAPSPAIGEAAAAIWERFVELIPADQRQMVSGFELLDEDDAGAYVYPDDDDPTRWVLGVSQGLGDDLDYVLIHEFAHLLTLQASEVPPGEDTGSCPTYHTGEGCALRGSTMAAFVARFWPEDRLDQIAELYENEDYDGLDEFYQRHADEFVTDYAASNPAEDLAETFAHFVTADRPTGDTIADQKIELLWADPDMIALRDRIRANL